MENIFESRPLGSGPAENKLRKSTSLPASWTETPKYGGSALAELERQRHERQAGVEPRHFLSWAERQRLVDAPPSPLFPMLVAIGMLFVFSVSLTARDTDHELLQILNERIEVPFVPHEAETLQERSKVEVTEHDADSDAESDLLLLHKKREFISKDEGDRLLEWVDRATSLGEIMLKNGDFEVLLTQAPSELVPLVQSVLKQDRELKTLLRRNFTLATLLQQDVVAVAELILLCRILALNDMLDNEQTARLKELLKLVAKRFGQEWPEAISLTRYVSSARELKLYLRLVNLIASAAEATSNYVLAFGDKETSEALKQARERLAWKIVTGRFEMQRLLEEAKFPDDIAEAFRTD